MNKIIKKIKQLFKKDKKIKDEQAKAPMQNQQEEVKKRLKSLGYFDE